MPDINLAFHLPSTVDLAAVTAVVVILLQWAKPIVETWVPPTAPSHDSILRGFAGVCAITLILLDQYAAGAFQLIAAGIGVALTASGAYRTVVPVPVSPPAATPPTSPTP